MKRKFLYGIALCLALSVAGCGKSSEEQQAANYYQNELGLDKEDAEELAHELYGEDEDEPMEEPSIAEEGPEEIVVEPLPELVNSEWFDFKVQIYDMVFDNYSDMTEEVIRKIVEGSAYDVELTEGFDSEGNISINSIEIDGKCVAILQRRRPNNVGAEVARAALQSGLLNDGLYYVFSYGPFSTENTWYDKKSIEFEDLKTREDVLAYLNENGFAEVEDTRQTPYYTSMTMWDKYDGREIDSENIYDITPDFDNYEFADVPHYYCQGAQSISFYRIHKVSETDQVVWISQYREHSGAHLNYVYSVTFEFDTDGTILSMSSKMGRWMILGEYI